MRKKVYAAKGYNTLFYGPGRSEFDPSKPMPTFDTYLHEAARAVLKQVDPGLIDEGVIGSFMSPRFVKQANLPALLPMVVPQLEGKPCTGVEGACGTGARAIATALRSILADLADVVYVTGFEVQNTVKSVYGADILAGAGYYQKERKEGHAFFFPGIFSDRAGAYFERYGRDLTRQAFAKWYEQAILNARKYPKAQEYENRTSDLYEKALTPPDPEKFLPHLNLYDCSKVSDGASAILILSEEGLKKCGIPLNEAVEIIGIGESIGDISKTPEDPTAFEHNRQASEKAFKMAKLTWQEIDCLEIHDCFTISAVLSIEALGLAPKGQGPEWILEGHASPTGRLPTNLSGGLIGFGHPTGASGVRQMVDLWEQLNGRALNPAPIQKGHGMMISMGGNDKTVTSFIVRKKV